MTIQIRGRHWPDSMGWQDTDFLPDDLSPAEWVALMNSGDSQIEYRVAPVQTVPDVSVVHPDEALPYVIFRAARRSVRVSFDEIEQHQRDKCYSTFREALEACYWTWRSSLVPDGSRH